MSLFNSETTRITPLDFRLTAAAQFHLLALMCSSSAIVVNAIHDEFSREKLVNANALSNASFITQVDIIIKKYYAKLELSVKPSYAAQLVMSIFDQSLTQSALHTDGFTWSVPGWDQFNVVSNFYPRHDNASFSNVSLLRDALWECEQNRSKIHFGFRLASFVTHLKSNDACTENTTA